MKLVGVLGVGPTPYDGLYLVDYDPDRTGTDPSGESMLCHLTATIDRSKARRFKSLGELHETWRQASKKWPLRPDGRPNRPLTAFTITPETVDGPVSDLVPQPTPLWG